MNKEEKLAKMIDDARRELNEIRDEKRKSENKMFLGKFYKYRNSYSCPEPDEYWWYYVAVTDMNEYGNLFGWAFQTDVEGKSEVEDKIAVGSHLLVNRISPNEFWKAYNQLLKELQDKVEQTDA